jgi:CRP-like cAMP-binding protein
MPGTDVQRTFDKITALRNTELFANISESVLAQAAARAVIRHLQANEVLFSEHAQASGLYIVVDGELRSIRQNAKGREQVLSTERAGAILAATPVFNGGKFYCTTIADTPCHVLCIQTQDIHDLCHQHTELLWALAKLFAHKVRHYAALIETLALRNVDQRVAQHLLTACQERGKREGDACVVELNMTQAEMASRIGSTREVVCRALAHLESDALIQMRGKRTVRIPSMPALRKFAGILHDLDDPRIVSELSSDIA